LTGEGEADRVNVCFGEEVTMVKCDRCGGVMAYEKFYGQAEDYFGWRCIVCGDIIDRVILENRSRRKR